jgi:hypothetical protein
MPRLSGPWFPPFGRSHEPLPLTPPHVVDPQHFPAPTWDELTAVIRDRQDAYLAWLALRRAPAEVRILALLAVRVFQERHCRRRPPAGPPAEGR